MLFTFFPDEQTRDNSRPQFGTIMGTPPEFEQVKELDQLPESRDSSPSDSPSEDPDPASSPPSHKQQPPKCPTVWQRCKSHLKDNIKAETLAESKLIMLTFCTGIQDATTFPDYHCFASNQTGNTIFLGLALLLPQLNGEMFVTPNIAVGLAFFLLSGCLTGQVGHRVGPRKRWWLLLCNLLQTALVFTAAGIQFVHGVQLRSTLGLVVISMLAFAAGSQVVQSRALAMTEITTAMATAAWIDLLIDRNIFVLKNRPRTRRFFFLLALITGTLTGAGMWRTVGSAPAIALSAAGKLVVTLLYLLTPAERPKKDGSAV